MVVLSTFTQQKYFLNFASIMSSLVSSHVGSRSLAMKKRKRLACYITDTFAMKVMAALFTTSKTQTARHKTAAL